MEFVNIAGGVATILFSIRFLRKGLDRIFGKQLWVWVQRFAKRPLGGLATGTAVSILTPSSTGMSLFAVQAVQAGHVTTRQMLPVVLGADIGLTVIIQMAALNVDALAPALIFVGVAMFQFMKNTKTRGIGQILVSLGFLFIGIEMIKSVARGIDPNGNFAHLLQILTHYPLVMLLTAAGVSMVLQSSTATVGLLIGLASQDAQILPLPLAVAVVLGANLGTGCTMLVFGWTHVQSRRLALANVMIKGAMCFAVLALMPLVVSGLEAYPSSMMRKVADMHTGFNLAKALLALPLIFPVLLLIEKLIPEPPSGATELGPKYLSSGPIENIALAEGQALREIMRVAELVRLMLDDVWRALRSNDEKLVRDVSSRDDQIDLLDREIKRYLTRLSAHGLDQHEATEQMRQLRYLSELETIGDIIDKNICELVQKKIKLGVDFSPDGWRDLAELFKQVAQNALIADTAFHTRDAVLAQQLLDNKRVLDETVRELRDRHFARLNEGRPESHQTSAIHLDILTNLKRINSHLSHVAYATLQQHGSSATEKALPAPAAPASESSTGAARIVWPRPSMTERPVL
jgi:phosphate:Na+ symporter